MSEEAHFVPQCPFAVTSCHKAKEGNASKGEEVKERDVSISPFAGQFSKQKCVVRWSHGLQTQDDTLLMNWYFRHLANNRRITCLCHLSGGNFYDKNLILVRSPQDQATMAPSPEDGF